MPWTPTSQIVQDWGRPRLVIGGVDVTYYRGVPIQVEGWESVEPFDDSTLTVKFPQITTLEALPSWLYDFANVDLYLVRPDNTQKILWEGLWVSENDRTSESETGLQLECVGALFQTDFYRKKPEMFRYNNGEDDIMLLISAEFSPDLRPNIRTLPLRTPGWSGVTYDQIGSWQPSLTGYVQELLAAGTSSGMPLPGEAVVGIVGKPDGTGYWLVGSDGSVLPFGAARYYGSMVGTKLTEAASGICVTPNGENYWFGARDGGVFTFGFDIGFWGSLGATGNPYDIEGIEAMPDSAGYVLVDEVGTVFPFGSAANYGNIGGSMTALDKAVDIALTPSGHGYWIVTAFGYVYSFGDATYYGGVNDNTKRFVAMAAKPNGTGYWLLQDNGTIYNFGSAAAYTTITPTIRASDLSSTPSGAGLWLCDEAGGVFTKGDATYYGSCLDGGGTDSQWTVMKQDGRQPVLRVKNVWDVQWTVTLGSQGVSHDLTRDLTMAPNAFYGEGTDPDGCTWRNSKYPGLQITPTATYAVELTRGSTHATVIVWERRMQESGWDIVPDGVFSAADANICRTFQEQAGLAKTGTVNAQTWAATFQVGSQASDFKSAYIAPLAMTEEVQKYLYNPKGDRVGDNPAFDRNVPRIETHDNYGSRVTKYEGTVSAEGRLRRDYPAAYYGTLTLRIDPQEGSRFEMKAGQNILVKGHRGVNKIFHIAQIEVNFEELSVTVHLDMAARDALTLAAFRDRYREAIDPTNRPKMQYRNSKQSEDRKVNWDCESGAGIIPYHAINAGLWNVLRIPCGESGNIVHSEFNVVTPARFSVGVFDTPVTHAMLAGVGVSPLDDGYWDDDTGTSFWNNWGLIMAYGGSGQAGGFYPGKESDGDLLTGRMVDDASWYFQSRNPPWLWVALWVESPGTNYISGRISPGWLT